MAVDVQAEPNDRVVEREVILRVSREETAREDARPAIVKDASGTRWRVTEVDAHGVPGARGESCLIFESDSAIRRVWHYPPSWRDLPSQELLRVSWGK